MENLLDEINLNPRTLKRKSRLCEHIRNQKYGKGYTYQTGKKVKKDVFEYTL